MVQHDSSQNISPLALGTVSLLFDESNFFDPTENFSVD